MTPADTAKTDQADGALPCATASYAFDGFVLAPNQEGLFRDGERIALSARALDLLTILVRAAGTVVPRELLLRRVWHSGDIADANLRVQISILRKTLAERGGGLRHIDSVPGKGYCFVAHVQPASPQRQEARPDDAAAPPSDPAHALFGRADTLDELHELLRERGQVSLLGPGGVGKSALARALAARFSLPGAARVALFDLALPPGAQEAPDGADGADAPALVVLENCEYDGERAARLLQELALRWPAAPLLAVGRETLQIRRETVFRLAPLALPPRGAGLSLAEACRYAAVQLFCARARQGCPALHIGDEHVPDLIELCQALDGLPLALELAARRAVVCDVNELLKQAAAAPRANPGADAPQSDARAQSMWHALDWSFNRLSAREQMALCRLSIFRGSFGLISVSSALVGCGLPEALVLRTFQALVAKSLVVVERQADFTLYRLLNSTRAYALERYVERKQLCEAPCTTDIRHLPPPVLSPAVLAP